MVAMETFKNEIFVLSSFFCSNWYIICKNSEKKIFVRPNSSIDGAGSGPKLWDSAVL